MATLKMRKTYVVGYPQESILIPLLFLIYVNDLSFVIPYVKLARYVNDTSYKISKLQRMHKKTEFENAEVKNWFSFDRLI